MLRNEISQILFNRLYEVEPYPNTVAPIIKMIDETAFFPGGKGLWLEKEETDAFPSILVLGQDFSTLKEYQKMLDNNSKDLDCPTWKNIIKLFGEVGIRLPDCFFSNVFMGLRKTESMVGKFPGFKDKEFVRRNLDFLTLQVDTIRPKIIITLGIYAPMMLGDLSPDLISWKNARSFKDIDESIKFDVNFGSHQCTCIALVHPCMRNTNVRFRKFKNYIGHNAETEMLKEALRHF